MGKATTTLVEREQADRFPAARVSYVVWSREQGQKAREMTAPATPPEPPTTTITDKFNEAGQAL